MEFGCNRVRPVHTLGRAAMHSVHTQLVRDQHRPLLHHPARIRVHAASQRQAHAHHDPGRVAALGPNLHTAAARLGQAVGACRSRRHVRLLVRPQVSDLRHSVRLLSPSSRHDHHLYKHLSGG